MNSSGDPAFCSAFCTVSGEQATRICTLALPLGAAFTVAAKPRAACSRSPLLRRPRASARLAGVVRAAPGGVVPAIGVGRGDGVTGAGARVLAGVVAGPVATLPPGAAGVRPQR